MEILAPSVVKKLLTVTPAELKHMENVTANKKKQISK